MITKENYSEEHIRAIQASSRRDPGLIERSLYAMGLLEALRLSGLDFIFKGGSCLMLLLPHIMRLSTDIDIVVAPGTDVYSYIDKASKIFPFKDKKEETRKGKNNIVKKHFKFTYYSPIRQSDFYILLDILFEENNYDALTEKKIENELLLTEGDSLSVYTPSIDCILGDKLTAFAPYTTGIPLRQDKDMEVMKQFFDIGTLISEYKNFDHVLKTYRKVALAEIGYRGGDFSIQDVLRDTISSSIVIAARGKVGEEDYSSFKDGIHAVSTHIFGENYSCELAAYRAANVIYMAACLLGETEYTRINSYDEFIGEQLKTPELKILARMRKAQPLQYAYLVKADRILYEL